MQQTIYKPRVAVTLNPAVLQDVTHEMQEMGFTPSTLTPQNATYRSGDRYVTFVLNDGAVYTRLGVGSHDLSEHNINAMRLDEMIKLLFGGMQRGCHPLTDETLHACLASAMSDLKEFAHEFLRGDFRPFLRVLAIKHREDVAAEGAKKPNDQIYMA